MVEILINAKDPYNPLFLFNNSKRISKEHCSIMVPTSEYLSGSLANTNQIMRADPNICNSNTDRTDSHSLIQILLVWPAVESGNQYNGVYDQ